MQIKVKVITPLEARKILEEKNPNNRNIRKWTVEKYAEDMKAGRWEENGDPIQFDSKGNLKNGQHRLSAIVKSNTPVKMLCVYGVESCLFDRGAVRSETDILKFEGCEPTIANNNIIACIRLMLISSTGRNAFSTGEVREFAENHMDAIKFVYHNCCNRKGTATSARISPFEAALFIAYECGEKPADLKRFIECYLTGFYTSEKETAALVLRNMVLAKLLDARGQTGQREFFKQTQRAIYDSCRGTARKRNYNEKEHTYMKKWKEMNK